MSGHGDADEPDDDGADGEDAGLDDSLLPPSGADGDPGAPGADAPGSGGDAAGPAEDAPLDDLAERARHAGAEAEEDDGVMDAFESVPVDDVDVDELWSELEGEDLDDAVDEPRTTSERSVDVVDKREYCQRCTYFSAPPEVRCTHETGEILELVDTERFRVADCPILRGEEEL